MSQVRPLMSWRDTMLREKRLIKAGKLESMGSLQPGQSALPWNHLCHTRPLSRTTAPFEAQQAPAASFSPTKPSIEVALTIHPLI